MPLIETNNLSKHYSFGGGIWGGEDEEDVAVRHVDLRVKQEEVLGLVGESGSGKSTLAQLLLRLESPTSGEIFFRDGRVDNLTQRQFRPRRRDIQIVFQDPQESFDPRYTIRDCIAEGLLNLTDLDRTDRLKRIDSIVDQVNLGRDLLEKYPHQLSGGQRQRAGIARALVVEPEMIVLDEPTSALDVSIQAQIVNLLLDLKAEFGLTYLFISHDMNLVRFVSDRVAVMKDGRIVERGKSSSVYESPQSTYAQKLLKATSKHRPETV